MIEENLDTKYLEENLDEKEEIDYSVNEEELNEELKNEFKAEEELHKELKLGEESKEEENLYESISKEIETKEEKENKEEKEIDKDNVKEEEENEKTDNISEKEKNVYNCNLEKCSECTPESEQLNLCKKCNIEKNYYPLNTMEAIKENEYFDCFNEITKPQGFYFDEINQDYKLCYFNCKTCDFGGDGNNNNCTSCKNDLILKPDIPNSSNCVVRCTFFYYYQGNQYKCTNNENCPDNYQLEINEKRKCIDKCEKDDTYKIRYDGGCYKNLPEGTKYDENKKISRDIDINKCKLNKKILRLEADKNITEYEIETKAKLYTKEFDYTNVHITVYKNDFYSITLYKDKKCITEFDLNVDEIDFGECYLKIKDELNIENTLIIVIISKIINGISMTINIFVFNPNSGEKIDFINICNDETIIVFKNLKNQITDSESFESMEELTKQGINIFDPNNDFYTDLCFHFKSPIDGKDIPLKDRLKLFFPNITLCDEGCNIKGVNLTTWKAECQCTLSNLINNNIFGNNLFVQKSFGEAQDLLTKTNIEVMKCYKDIFNKEMYKKNTGFIIIIILIFFQIIFTLIYYFKYKIKIKKYVLIITDKYLTFLQNKMNTYLIKNSSKQIDIIKSSPPKQNSGFEVNSQNKNTNNYGRKLLINKPKTVINKKVDKNESRKIIDNHRKFSIQINSNINKESHKQLINSNNIMIENIKLNNKPYEPLIPYLSNNININIEEYIKTDPDNMDYDEAIRNDKRTFCQYFIGRFKAEQIILNTFFKYEVLKPLPIKIILLILNFDLYLIINGLFFNENYISDLLHSGSETVWSFINRIFDRIFIITITGVIINYIIEFFFVEESKIKKLLKVGIDNIVVLKYEIVQLIKNTYIRYKFFIIISSIVMIFSLYYIFCFNNIYPCIKIEWLKSSLIIIAIMQILPIILCFLDTSIRFISFKCKSERLFRLSSIFL